jgi:hypothetical protein
VTGKHTWPWSDQSVERRPSGTPLGSETATASHSHPSESTRYTVALLKPRTEGARVCAGLDWAKNHDAIAIIVLDGQVVDRFAVTHDAAGLKSLVRRLLKAGVGEAGIERGDGPVVEALIQAELTVLVIPTGQLKNLRSRYGSAGNKDDRYDAYILADVVRTDRWRLHPLVQDSAISLTFLERFTTQAQADWLSPKRLGTWLSSVSYGGHTDPEILHTPLRAAPQGIIGVEAQVLTVTALACVGKWPSKRKRSRS